MLFPNFFPNPIYEMGSNHEHSISARWIVILFAISEAAKHQVFEGHSPYLPEVALLAVYFEAAFARVVKTHGHVEDAIALIVAHDDGVVGKGEYH